MELYKYLEKIMKVRFQRKVVADGIDLPFLYECRRNKEALSVRSESEFQAELPGRHQVLRMTMIRERFEQVIQVEVKKTIDMTLSFLEEAKTAGHEVKSLILIGGSSRIPLVSETLRKSLPLEMREWQNKHVAVALGAAYYGDILWGKKAWASPVLPALKDDANTIPLATVCPLPARPAPKADSIPLATLSPPPASPSPKPDPCPWLKPVLPVPPRLRGAVEIPVVDRHSPGKADRSPERSPPPPRVVLPVIYDEEEVRPAARHRPDAERSDRSPANAPAKRGMIGKLRSDWAVIACLSVALIVGAVTMAGLPWLFLPGSPELKGDVEEYLKRLQIGKTQEYIDLEGPRRIDVWRRAAEKGSPEGQFLYGSCLYRRTGTTKNEVEGVAWLRKAADQGFALAQNSLGYSYNNGKGVDKNQMEAVRWYRKAADQGLAVGQHNLANCYYYGTGVERDPVVAVRWFRKAADKGYAWAQDNLGDCYSHGTGVERDQVEAVRWFRKAADQGLADGQFSLGFCYHHGTGVEKNPAEAIHWYRKAADQGHAPAKESLAAIENGN